MVTIPRSSEFTVVALISAYNEVDIIGHVVGDFIAQGIHVYLLDDGSTDGTPAVVEPFLGRGVIAIERLNDTLADRAPGRFEWERILRRKAQLAAELPADWFIHNDADEFRESPWPGIALSGAIRMVDRLGYNAIDSARLDFWPTAGDVPFGADPRQHLTHWSEPAPYDRAQIRCWRRTERPVDLFSTGGHEARFEGRRVFPIRFVLKHYPIRGSQHGRRKVFAERRERFLPSERAIGWHVQYDECDHHTEFRRPADELNAYDEEGFKVHLSIDHRGVEELHAEVGRLEEAARQVNHLRERAVRLEAAEQTLTTTAEKLREALVNLAALDARLEQSTQTMATLHSALANAETEIQALRASISWKVTAPGRAVFRLITGR